MKRIIILVVFVAYVIFFVGSALAGTGTVAWNADADANVTDYKLYWGTTTRTYPNVINCGNVLQYGPITFTDNQWIYVAVTAVDPSLGESDYSMELVFYSGVGSNYLLHVPSQTNVTNTNGLKEKIAVNGQTLE